MHRFRFRLEKLLALRQQEVEEARRRLAAALRQAEAARRGYEALRAHRLHRQALFGAAVSEGLSAGDFAAWRRHLQYLTRLEEEAARDLAAAEAAVTACRDQLLARRRAAEILEKLRRRRYEEWQLAVARAEQAEADELAILREGSDPRWPSRRHATG